MPSLILSQRVAMIVGGVFCFMAKELPYFKFEISEWMFGRIQKQSEDIQGMFINLCCKYWHKLGEYDYESACLDFDKERIDRLIDSKIIGVDGGYLFIKFLDIQLDECEQSSKKQSIKGLKSAAVRAARKQPISTTVQPRLTTVQPNSTEEKRIEENRIEDKRVDRNFLWFKNQFDEIYLDQLKATHKGKDIQQAILESFAHLAADKIRLNRSDQSDCKKLLNTWLTNQKQHYDRKSNKSPIIPEFSGDYSQPL